MRTEGCKDAGQVEHLLPKRSPLAYTESHLPQDMAAVTSQLYVPSTRSLPSTLCVTAEHLCWSRNSRWNWSADFSPCPLLTDLCYRPKRIHVFSLSLILNTYHGSVAPLSPLPSVQGPSAAVWQEVNERRDLKVWSKKRRGGCEGTSQVWESCFVFWGALPMCAGFLVGRAQWRAFSLIQCVFYLCRLLADLV